MNAISKLASIPFQRHAYVFSNNYILPFIRHSKLLKKINVGYVDWDDALDFEAWNEDR